MIIMKLNETNETVEELKRLVAYHNGASCAAVRLTVLRRRLACVFLRERLRKVQLWCDGRGFGLLDRQ